MSLTKEDKEAYIQIWTKAVDTQMHFNEMSAKSRQLGLTFVAAALGVGVVLIGRGGDFALEFELWDCIIKIHVSVLIIAAAALAMQAVRILDLNVYHKMLRGAVTFGEDFEQNYMKQVFALNKGMTQAISHFSRHNDANVVSKEGKYIYQGSDQKNAEKKIRRFYNLTVGALAVTSIALFIITNLTQDEKVVKNNDSPGIEAPRANEEK